MSDDAEQLRGQLEELRSAYKTLLESKARQDRRMLAFLRELGELRTEMRDRFERLYGLLTKDEEP